MARVEKLLLESRSELGISPSRAENVVNEVVRLSQAGNNQKNSVDAFIILGDIKSVQSSFVKALEFFNKAGELAEKIGYTEGVCDAKIETGIIYYTWGFYNKSQNYFQDAYYLALKNNLAQKEVKSLNYIGKCYKIKGDFEGSLPFFNRALEISRKLNDYQQVALSLNLIGKYYVSQGKLDLALQCFLESYKACDHFHNQVIFSEVCSHLGALYLQTNQYEKSLEYHRKALACRNAINNPKGIAGSYNNIGKAYLELKFIDSSIIYFNQSLQISKKIGYKKGIVKSLVNLGKAWAIQNNTLKAEDFLQEAYNIANSAGYDIGVAESALELGSLYHSCHQTDKAIFYFKTSLEKLSESNLDEMMRDNYLGLYGCYSRRGEYQEALRYHVLLLEKEKKLLNVDNARHLAVLQIAFDSERKEKDNQLLRNDIQLKELMIKRNATLMCLIVIVLGFTMVLCLLIYSRLKNKRKANRRLEVLNLQISSQNIELEKLNKELNKASMEKDKIFSIIAHELRNPLYWFQNLAEVLSRKYQDMTPEKVQKTLVALDESAKNAFCLMDNLLHWSRSRLNRIKPKKAVYSLKAQVTESVFIYQTIIQYKEISLDILLPGHLQVLVDADLFCCIIRNLVSNAIKFTPAGGRICIECADNPDLCIIMVSDSGKGISSESLGRIFDQDCRETQPGIMQEKGSGLGLKLCKEFAELNGGKIWASSKPGEGTRFFFTVPVAPAIKPSETPLFLLDSPKCQGTVNNLSMQK